MNIDFLTISIIINQTLKEDYIMTPWQKSELLLEECFEKIVDIYNKTQNLEAEQVGSCIVTLIALCQDIEKMDSINEKNKFWKTIEGNIEELIKDSNEFIEQKQK